MRIRKRRVTGRFFLFLMLVATVILFAFRNQLFGGVQTALVASATAADIRTAQAIVVRHESVASYNQVSRITYVANEHTLVHAGDEVAYVYSASYSEKLIRELNTLRATIQAYHKSIMADILDSELTLLDDAVAQSALTIKQLVNGKATGNVLKLVNQLNQSMINRQEYIRANKRSDQKLIKYYDEETAKLNTIAGWRMTETAATEGVVSFYMDGYESLLTPESLENLTISDAQLIWNGGTPSGVAASKAQTPIYRIVDQNHWYLVILSTDPNWNPVTGQVYSFQLAGYEDLVYNGTMIRLKKSGGYVMAQLEVVDPIGPLIYQRSGNATIGTNLVGLSVPKKALGTVSGQVGVWVYDVPGGTFVPVEVLSSDSENALIQPLTDGILAPGARVLIQ